MGNARGDPLTQKSALSSVAPVRGGLAGGRPTSPRLTCRRDRSLGYLNLLAASRYASFQHASRHGRDRPGVTRTLSPAAPLRWRVPVVVLRKALPANGNPGTSWRPVGTTAGGRNSQPGVAARSSIGDGRRWAPPLDSCVGAGAPAGGPPNQHAPLEPVPSCGRWLMAVPTAGPGLGALGRQILGGPLPDAHCLSRRRPARTCRRTQYPSRSISGSCRRHEPARRLRRPSAFPQEFRGALMTPGGWSNRQPPGPARSEGSRRGTGGCPSVPCAARHRNFTSVHAARSEGLGDPSVGPAHPPSSSSDLLPRPASLCCGVRAPDPQGRRGLGRARHS